MRFHSAFCAVVLSAAAASAFTFSPLVVTPSTARNARVFAPTPTQPAFGLPSTSYVQPSSASATALNNNNEKHTNIMSGKIALFGATGMCGSALMRKALAEGYQVNAMVRSSSKITEENDKLTVIEGDLENTDAIQKTIENVDHVVVMLGGVIGDPKNYPAGFITRSVEGIVEQMKKQSSINSLTILTGAFSKEPGEERPFFSRQLTRAIVRLGGMKPNIEDHQGVNTFIGSIQNDVSFGTIVMRPSMLGDGEFKSAVKVLEKSPSIMRKVTNEELAVYALEVMKDESMYGKFPFIGHK